MCSLNLMPRRFSPKIKALALHDVTFFLDKNHFVDHITIFGALSLTCISFNNIKMPKVQCIVLKYGSKQYV